MTGRGSQAVTPGASPPTPLSEDEALLAYTRQRRKVELFAEDPSARRLHAVVGGGRAAAAAWQSHSLTIIKPEGLFFGHTRQILDFVERSGLLPVQAAVVRITPSRADAMWRYVLNAATTPRRALAFELLNASSSIAILWRDRTAGTLPGTVRLARLKGSADPALRSAATLRGLLDTPNRVISHVHVSDEPLDVIRELLCLCDPRSFARFEAATLDPAGRAQAEAIKAWVIGRSERLPRAQLRHVRLDRELRAGDWPSLLTGQAHLDRPRRPDGGLVLHQDALDEIGGGLDLWSRLLVHAQYGDHDQPGVEKLLPETGYDEWARCDEHRLEAAT